jgi:histidinol-phosphatase
MAGYDDDLRFAHVLADAADDITARRFRAADLRVEIKPDLTPVTDADHATEESLRNVLRRARPRDAMLGEEAGRSGSGARCWVIDPIDATKNYVRGVPVWATLIGLMDGDEVVVGVVSAPALSRRWWAARFPTPTCPAGSRAAGWTDSSDWPARSGGPAPTGISGRTSW